MIFRYPDKFIVTVKSVRVESIEQDMTLKDENLERNRFDEALKELVEEFKNNEEIWCDIDNYYCDYEAGYI